MTDTIDTINVPSLLVVEQGSTPSAPAAGKQRLYIRDSDHHLVREDSGASVVDIEAAGGGSSVPDYIHIRDEKTSGTNGGTFTSGAWRTRDLNTEVSDSGGHASVASNQITLDAGTYRVRALCPALGVDTHQARLYNVTDSAVLILGPNAQAQASVDAGSSAFVIGTFVIGGSKTIELQHRCFTTKSTYGLGLATSWGTEVYASIEMEKVA